MTNSVKNLKGEVWKDIKGYPGYQVSNMGRVKSLKKKNKYFRKEDVFLKFQSNWGYYSVCLWKGGKAYRRMVNRLVLQAFIPNPLNKLQCNHKDGNKLNNHVGNLEWVTPSENNLHAHRTGLADTQRGEDSHFAVLKEEQVKEVRKVKLDLKIANEKIAKMFDVSRRTIDRIISKQTWKHI